MCDNNARTKDAARRVARWVLGEPSVASCGLRLYRGIRRPLRGRDYCLSGGPSTPGPWRTEVAFSNIPRRHLDCWGRTGHLAGSGQDQQGDLERNGPAMAPGWTLGFWVCDRWSAFVAKLRGAAPVGVGEDLQGRRAVSDRSAYRVGIGSFARRRIR